MMRRILFILALFLLCTDVFGQGKAVADSSFNLAHGQQFYLDGNKKEAAVYFEKALPQVKKFGRNYEILLESLGNIYMDLGNQKGIQRIMALMEEHNQHELTKTPATAAQMVERGQYFALKGDYETGKEWFIKALEQPMDDSEKTDVYMAYSQLLFSSKEFAAAAEYKHLAAVLKYNASGESDDYLNTCFSAATLYYLGGKYQEAITLYGTVADYYKQFDSVAAKKNLARCKKGMGNAYAALRDWENAIDSYSEEVKQYGEVAPEGDEYPSALSRLAGAEKFAKQYEKAIEHYLLALDIFDRKGMTEKYGETAASLQLCYAYTGQNTQVDMKEGKIREEQRKKLQAIIDEELMNLEMVQKYLGPLNYSRSLATIAGCYFMNEEYSQSVYYYKQYIANIRDAVRKSFLLQTPLERMTTWKDEVATIQEIKEVLATLPSGNESIMKDLTGIVYDAALLSKGILLRSSIEFEKVLREQANPSMTKRYGQIKDNENSIAHLRETASTEADLKKILKLEAENRKLSLGLYRDCAAYADYTDYLSYDWKAVCSRLGTNDVAVEFVEIDLGPLSPENCMAALVLTKDISSPIAIPVCSLEYARKMPEDKSLFTTPGNLIWGALSSVLQGKEMVFFSADGVFNQTAIEYLLYDGKVFSDSFKVYRLSTTKELCYAHQQHPMQSVVLFGDIDYNRFDGSDKKDDELRGHVSGFAPLKSTRKELDDISSMLERAGIGGVKVYRESQAGAEAFKNLSGEHVNLLHIATHGVYDQTKAKDEKSSMETCQLIFAGANSGKGRVSASEVSQMDLRDCDLVVLSACETGLGKLGSDGVFGLQRGFKNAGVQSILMSLKPVYDSSTAELMSLFYKHLASGETKRAALVNARKDLREQGYSDAAYWAPFIILDALE